MKNSDTRGFWYGFNITAGILSLCFLVLLLAAPLLYAFEQFVQSVDFTAHQETQTSAFVPTSFTIDITNAQNTPLNAVEFELAYDHAALLITAIVPHTTLCEDRFVIAKTFNNASGTALFQCGTVTPFTGNTGTIATVHVLPLVSGTTTVHFGERTHVLAHDGLGTDATRTVTGLTLTAL